MISSLSVLLRIQLLIITSYFIIEFVIRPIIVENGYNGIVKIFVLSYPNFCEAIAGTIVITTLLLVLKGKFRKSIGWLKEKHVPIISTLICGVYVILQEFKIHNIGGANVYDPYDVTFSIIGLVFGYIILIFIKPKYIVE